MRSDYGLYVVAVICFIVAVLFPAGTVPEYRFEQPMGQVATAIFLILGITFAVVGYSTRPKASLSTSAAAPSESPQLAKEQTTSVEEFSETSQTTPIAPEMPPASEEPARKKTKKRTRTTKRRRKKRTTRSK